ncbi:hypothetical protein I601_2747 [Nocardioides dokdonensis FR1436]|uniref:DUF3352 domain-containing protein n=1 Tax=Nocardioides dokdonensis FR1436 TaxID=1300347 RepID=A0A1A9GNJ4_9ACTN|nr:hypothetical protein I601_2747 [Nocardioides dokdonensis FR1436]
MLGLGVVGGAAFGAYWYLSEGAQAAEALPADSIGYVGLNLDPSGRQKLEALETLKKLPTIAAELDLDGPVEDIDVKQVVAEAVLADAPCEIDYAEDVRPWLGDRFGAAAVPSGDEPASMVLVVEVLDDEAAEEGVRDLLTCDGSDAGESAGWVVEDGWLVLAETPEIARGVVDDTAEGSLAEDEDFRRWTGEVGDAGVLTLYAAPEAPRVLADALGGFFGPGAVAGMPSAYTDETSGSQGPDELDEAFEDFEGMAAVLRFEDGAVEIEAAGAAQDATAMLGDGVGDLVTGLPDETTAVLAAGLAEGWVEKTFGEDPSVPVDLESLLGQAAALTVGPGLDPDALLEAVFTGALTDVPVAAVTRGDLASAEEALAEAGPLATGLEARQVGDRVLVGPTGTWLDAVEAGGSLGGTDLFTSVVPDADDAVVVFFLDLGEVGDVAAEADTAGALAQLRALGVSAHADGDVARALLRLTTD